jgi:acetyl esterase/lipase
MKLVHVLAIVLLLSSCKGNLDLVIPEKPLGLTSDFPMIFEEKIDLPYGNNPFQKFDLYLPSTKNTRNPVIVLLHQGAWRIGDKSFMNANVKRLIGKRINCAIVNANYRLTSTPGVTYLQQLEDINSLLLKLREESKNFGISTNFYLVGSSSGGHLAMLYSNNQLGDRLASGVAGVVPPVDLTSPSMLTGLIKNDVMSLIGKPYTEASEEYFKASPVFYFSPRTPPTIVFFNGKDEIVTPEQAEICRKMMFVNRVRNEFVLNPLAKHEDINWDETLDKIIKFAEKNL